MTRRYSTGRTTAADIAHKKELAKLRWKRRKKLSTPPSLDA